MKLLTEIRFKRKKHAYYTYSVDITEHHELLFDTRSGNYILNIYKDGDFDNRIIYPSLKEFKRAYPENVFKTAAIALNKLAQNDMRNSDMMETIHRGKLEGVVNNTEYGV